MSDSNQSPKRGASSGRRAAFVTRKRGHRLPMKPGMAGFTGLRAEEQRAERAKFLLSSCSTKRPKTACCCLHKLPRLNQYDSGQGSAAYPGNREIERRIKVIHPLERDGHGHSRHKNAAMASVVTSVHLPPVQLCTKSRSTTSSAGAVKTATRATASISKVTLRRACIAARFWKVAYRRESRELPS